MSSVNVIYEPTPNPASMKFLINEQICEENVSFSSAQEAQRSPLAAKIFGFPWTAGIFLGANFVTVTKADWVDWETLADPLAGLIKEHIEAGLPILVEVLEKRTNNVDDNDSPVVRSIKEVLNDEIRPAVAMDGGDILFDRFENGVVYLHMQGACSGCPSSTFTLKMGIETRLKEAVPEVQEVVAI